ncbi:hypothetical protein SY83_06255 [Paenibacillus swuensis]|uniref:Uncharacterized protein n=1 Tax=Paenibacillus swuensis TaxID=1178515 RepID=A0A172TFW1_9BACL|nr:hypothetical protein [Paenibacillus swuensis]ANE45955.1 hypothetical protein SY83_06255 [Paenibacillus swuensis]
MKPDKDQLTLDQQKLTEEWNNTLPTILGSSDKATVQADAADPRSLRVAIANSGRTQYSFDFKVTYTDSREIDTQLVDVEADGIHVDEHTEIIQNMIHDYVRHMRECAQNLQQITHYSSSN